MNWTGRKKGGRGKACIKNIPGICFDQVWLSWHGDNCLGKQNLLLIVPRKGDMPYHIGPHGAASGSVGRQKE